MRNGLSLDELTQVMKDYLSDGEWKTRRDMNGCLTSRECRRARANARGEIIFGQRGYRLTARADKHEVNQCKLALESMTFSLHKQLKQLQTKALRT